MISLPNLGTFDSELKSFIHAYAKGKGEEKLGDKTKDKCFNSWKLGLHTSIRKTNLVEVIIMASIKLAI